MKDIKPNISQCYRCNYCDEYIDLMTKKIFCLAKLTPSVDSYGYPFSKPEEIQDKMVDIDRCPVFMERSK